MNRSFPPLSSFLAALVCGLLLALGTASGWAEDALGTFKIGSQTTITLDGQPATADQLKPGMRAYVQPDSLQEGFALSIDAQTDKVAAEAAKAKEKTTTDKTKAAPAPSKAQNPTLTAASATSITVEMK